MCGYSNKFWLSEAEASRCQVQAQHRQLSTLSQKRARGVVWRPQVSMRYYQKIQWLCRFFKNVLQYKTHCRYAPSKYFVKQLRNPSFMSDFSSAVMAASMSWNDSKGWPFMVTLTVGKSQKLHSAGYGGQRHCDVFTARLSTLHGAWQQHSMDFCSRLIETLKTWLENCSRKWHKWRDWCPQRYGQSSVLTATHCSVSFTVATFKNLHIQCIFRPSLVFCSLAWHPRISLCLMQARKCNRRNGSACRKRIQWV